MKIEQKDDIFILTDFNKFDLERYPKLENIELELADWDVDEGPDCIAPDGIFCKKLNCNKCMKNSKVYIKHNKTKTNEN
jgi:hypothetical protein